MVNSYCSIECWDNVRPAQRTSTVNPVRPKPAGCARVRYKLNTVRRNGGYLDRCVCGRPARFFGCYPSAVTEESELLAEAQCSVTDVKICLGVIYCRELSP